VGHWCRDKNGIVYFRRVHGSMGTGVVQERAGNAWGCICISVEVYFWFA
jgi:hypothetical protein